MFIQYFIAYRAFAYWIVTSLTSNITISTTRTFLSVSFMIAKIRTCVVLSILTVNAVNFSSQTSGNTFGVSRVAFCYACESFLNTNLAANSVEFEVSRKYHMTFHWLKSYCTYGQFGSTLWSVWWEKPRPSIDKTTTLIINLWYFNSFFINKTAVVFSCTPFLITINTKILLPSWAWSYFFIPHFEFGKTCHELRCVSTIPCCNLYGPYQ